MAELRQEWQSLRKQLGNFICRLDNEGQHAVENYEIRQKIYDEASKSGYNRGFSAGAQDIWDTIAKFYAMPAAAQIEKFGTNDLKDIITTKGIYDFKVSVLQYYELKKKAEEEKKAPDIVLGDVIRGKDDTPFYNQSGIVIKILDDKIRYVTKEFARCEISIDVYEKYFEKTGERYDIVNSYFLKEAKAK